MATDDPDDQSRWSSVDDDDEDERLRNLLEENLKRLCDSVDPRKFMVQLRSQRIISRDDYEDIKSHVISTERTMHFLDIIMRRGSPGIRSFLQHLGYLYPTVYEQLMKEKAPAPPADYFKRLSMSSELSPPLISLIDCLMKDNKQKNDISKQLETVKKQAEELQEEKLIIQESLEDMDRLQAENERLRRERKQEKLENSRINERALQYVEQRDNLLQSCHLLTAERDEVTEKLSLIEEENDALKLKLKNVEGESKRHSESSQRWTEERMETEKRLDELQQENRSLRYQLDQYKAGQFSSGGINVPRAVPESQRNIVQDLKAANEILNDQIKQYRTESEETARLLTQKEADLHKKERLLDATVVERDQMKICLENLEQQRTISQTRHEEIWKHLQNIRTERDQALVQMSEMSRRWQAISAERDHLAKQLQLQIKQCELVEQENYDLRKANSTDVYMRRKRVINVNEYEEVKLPNNRNIEKKVSLTTAEKERNPFALFPSFHGIRRCNTGEEEWLVTVKTSDLFGAGTDANVSFTLYGRRNGQTVKSSDITLSPNSVSFKANSRVSFKIVTQVMGELYKLRIGHDNTGPAPGWHLDNVVLCLMGTDTKYVFFYNNWLSRREQGPQIVQEIPAKGMNIMTPPSEVKYTVQVMTASNVNIKKEDDFFVIVHGEYGDTGRRLFYHRKNKVIKQTSINEHVIRAVSLGKLLKVRVDYKGQGQWFVQKVVVTEQDNPDESITWECSRWFPMMRTRVRARPFPVSPSVDEEADQSSCSSSCDQEASSADAESRSRDVSDKGFVRRGIYAGEYERSDTLTVEVSNSLYRSDPEDEGMSDEDSGRPSSGTSIDSQDLKASRDEFSGFSVNSEDLKASREEERAVISKKNLDLLEEVTLNEAQLQVPKSPDKSVPFRYKLNGSTLKQCIVGGNRVGLFVGSRIPQSHSESLLEGQQLIKLQVAAGGREHDMSNISLEEAQHIFDDLLSSVEATFQDNQKGYEYMKSLMRSEGPNMADSLYVRSNLEVEGHDQETLTLHKGDIVHVTGTMYRYDRWYGTKLDTLTGSPTSLSGSLRSIHAQISTLARERDRMMMKTPDPLLPASCGATFPFTCQANTQCHQHTQIKATDVSVTISSHQMASSAQVLQAKREPPGGSNNRQGALLKPPRPPKPLALLQMPQSMQSEKIMAGKPYDMVKPYRGRHLRPVIMFCRDDFHEQMAAVFADVFVTDVKRERRVLDENELKALTESGQLVYSERHGNESSCLLTDTLYDVMVTERRKHLLLKLPVRCISALHAINIFPVIFVVKTRDSFHIKHSYETELIDNAIKFDYMTFSADEVRKPDLVCKKLCDRVSERQQSLVWVSQP